MAEALAAAIVLSGIAWGSGWGIFSLFLLCFLVAVIVLAWQTTHDRRLRRSGKNPILTPIREHPWESEAVFNPAAYFDGTLVHLLYRALGQDGISRIGYATSRNGIHFERLPHPIFEPHVPTPEKYRNPFTSPARLRYDRAMYASGGGWGGSEDPRMVSIKGRVHVTFNMFNGWDSMRVGLLSLNEQEFKNREWHWSFNFLSPPGRHKNWVLFPEKINGKYAVFHNLYDDDPNRVRVAYVDEIEVPDHLPPFESPDPHHVPDRVVSWHNRTRSAGAPPIKTPYGWLLFYHGMDKNDPNRYKVGALLLDLNDPTKVLYRSAYPVLSPDMPYENDWKPGIIYASGAIVKDVTLFLYYGGGDKTVSVATAPLEKFLSQLMRGEHAALHKTAVV